MSSAKYLETRKKRAVVLLLAIFFFLALILVLFPSGKFSRSSAKKGDAKKVNISREIEAGASAKTESETAGRPDSRYKETKGFPEKHSEPLFRLSVVIDDAGYSLEDIKPFLDYPGKLTIAVLPNLPYSTEIAGRAKAAGKEVIMHCPMEPIENLDPGPGVILTGLSNREIRERLAENFESVLEAEGMNNHMGSKATADPRVMGVVMEYLFEHGKFFLDSRTSTRTVARNTAEVHGVPYLERSVFLDNVTGNGPIKEQFMKGINLAQNKGSAILTGHVRNVEILSVLNEISPLLTGNRIKTVLLSDLFER